MKTRTVTVREGEFLGPLDPAWEPTPAIGYIGPLNSVEWMFWYNTAGAHKR